MLNKRPPQPAEPEDEPAKEKEAQDPNPRAALMEMLNKRQPKVEAVAVEQKTEEKETNPDPRAALMAMISKRAPKQPADELKSEATQQAEAPSSPVSPPSGPAGIASLAAAAARKKDQPSSPSSPSRSPGTRGFFPATTRDVRKDSQTHVTRTAREERYETKTSSNARGEATEPPSFGTSPVTQENRKNLYEVTEPIPEPERKRTNRINPHIEADAKTEAKGKNFIE